MATEHAGVEQTALPAVGIERAGQSRRGQIVDTAQPGMRTGRPDRCDPPCQALASEQRRAGRIQMAAAELDGVRMQGQHLLERARIIAAQHAGRAEAVGPEAGQGLHQPRARHAIGVGNMMWGSDYPHPEGSWPMTRQQQLDALHGIPDAELRWLYAHCAAVIAPSHEDFGLTPLEGAAYGRPALTLRGGGYLDTVVEGVTGAHFEEPTPELIAEAVAADLGRTWDPEPIQAHARSFSEEHFARRLRAEVDRLLADPAG